MPWTFEQLPDQPIVIQTLGKDYDYGTEGVASTDEISQFLDRQDQPTIYVINLLEASFGLDDLVAGINMATRQRKLFQHPKLRETIVVTTDLAMELAAKGMSKPIFGNVKIRTFKTLAEALAYAKDAAKA
jgi:hypothetical protein